MNYVKDDKKIIYFWGTILVFSTVALFIYQNSDSFSDSTSYLSYQKKAKLRGQIANKENDSINSDKKIKREIAQRRELPSRSSGSGPFPKPLRRKKKENSINSDNRYYEESEFDIQVGDLTLKHDIYALKDTEEIPDDYTIIDKKLGHYIVKTNQTPKNALGIVAVAGSKSFAIFTGVLRITLYDYEDKDVVLNDFDGNTAHSYEHLNTVLFQFDQFEKTMLAFKDLEGRAEVKKVSIELLQYQRSSK